MHDLIYLSHAQALGSTPSEGGASLGTPPSKQGSSEPFKKAQRGLAGSEEEPEASKVFLRHPMPSV